MTDEYKIPKDNGLSSIAPNTPTEAGFNEMNFFMKTPTPPSQKQIYQPDYSDPHGVNSLFREAKKKARIDQTLQLKTKEKEVFTTPYDNQGPFGLALPFKRHISPYKTHSRSQSYGLNNFTMTTKSEEQILHQPLTLKEEEKKDEIEVIVAVIIKGKEITNEVTLSKKCKVKEIKENALSKLRGILIESTSCFLLLKASNLLNEEDTLEAAKIKEGDKLLLIMDAGATNVQRINDIPRLKLAAEDLLPKITRNEYTIRPEPKKIFRMTETELKAIKNLQIENEWGRIEFEGETDVTGVDFDSTITISHQKIIVYPKDSLKPSIGQKLNKAATVHLFKCFPKTNTKTFINKLKIATRNQGAKFVSYNEKTGEWIFKVKHFSEYKFSMLLN